MAQKKETNPKGEQIVSEHIIEMDLIEKSKKLANKIDVRAEPAMSLDQKRLVRKYYTGLYIGFISSIIIYAYFISTLINNSN